MNKSLFVKIMIALALASSHALIVKATLADELNAIKVATDKDTLVTAINRVKIDTTDTGLPKQTTEHALGIIIVDKASAIMTTLSAQMVATAKTAGSGAGSGSADPIAELKTAVIAAASDKITTKAIQENVAKGINECSQGAKASVIATASITIARLCKGLFTGAQALFNGITAKITAAKDAFESALRGTSFSTDSDNYTSCIAEIEG